MADAEVVIDASKGFLSVKGDQDFVSQILEKYKSAFENRPIANSPAAPSSPASDSVPAASADSSALSVYSNVFGVDNGDVTILINPPGNTTAAQARNIALLYLYAKFKLGENSVNADLIKDQCKNHGCFDSKNFASQMKGMKGQVSITGSNSSTAMRLTVPGRNAAEELAKSLQGA